MAEPTIEKRLQRRFVLMSADEGMIERVRATAGDGWEVAAITDLDALGDWNDILLYRFVLLDLDEVDAFDPLDVISLLRREYMLNIAVFCFGGEPDLVDEMRMARADRFFGREEITEKLPQFLEQYGWGA